MERQKIGGATMEAETDRLVIQLAGMPVLEAEQHI